MSQMIRLPFYFIDLLLRIIHTLSRPIWSQEIPLQLGWTCIQIGMSFEPFGSAILCSTVLSNPLIPARLIFLFVQCVPTLGAICAPFLHVVTWFPVTPILVANIMPIRSGTFRFSHGCATVHDNDSNHHKKIRYKTHFYSLFINKNLSAPKQLTPKNYSTALA